MAHLVEPARWAWWLVAAAALGGCGDEPAPCQGVCGDRATTCQEECDDGNLQDGDGCSAACRLEVCPDADGDGHQSVGCGGDDCDDTQANVHPGAPESLDEQTCQDGLDNDCDGYTDATDLACFPCREHADCDDGDMCTGQERCQGNHCEAGQPLACDDGLFCNGPEGCDPLEGCLPGTAPCPEAAGCVRCRETEDTCFEADGTPCDEGDPCSTHDTCQTGVCSAGTVDLDADMDGYLAASCPDGDDCDDDNYWVNPGRGEFLFLDSCNNGLDDDCDGNTDVQDNGCWPCQVDADCDDGLFCNGSESCAPGEGCQDGTPPCPGTECRHCQEDIRTCFDPPGTSCGDPTETGCDHADTCDEQGTCSPNPAADDTPCEDGDVCNGAERCLAGACLSGQPLECDDGLYCDGPEGCDPIAGCQPGAAPCVPETDCFQCQEEGDTCLVAEGTACGNPAESACDHADRCDGQGVCQIAHAADGTPCEEGDPCSSHDACEAGLCMASALDLDADGDGHVALACGGDDCDDGAAAVNPDLEEATAGGNCDDTLDNDCDGYTDFADLGCGAPELVTSLVTDGGVTAFTEADGILYLASPNIQNVSRSPAAFLVLDADDGSVLTGSPEIYRASGVISDGQGGWFVNAFYQELFIGDQPWGDIVHLQASGEIDPNLNPIFEDGCIHALDSTGSPGGVLFVGGSFSRVNGTFAHGLVAFDIDTGQMQPWVMNTYDPVKHLAVCGDVVIVAGDFNSIQGHFRDGLASVDTQTGLVTPWHPSVTGNISALDCSNGILVLAGDFSAIDGVARDMIAAIDPSTGLVLPSSLDTQDWYSVQDIRMDGETAFIHFTGNSQDHIAALNARTGEVSPLDLSGPPQAASLLDGADGQLWLVIDRQLMSIATETGERKLLMPRFARNPTTCRADSGRLACLGFAGIDAVTRRNLAAFDTATLGFTDLEMDAEVNTGMVNDLAVSSTRIGIAGWGFLVGGIDAQGFLILDRDTGQVVPGIPFLGEEASFYKLAATPSRFYLGGFFTLPGWEYEISLGAVDSASGQIIDWAPAGFYQLYGMGLIDGRLFVGPYWTPAGDDTLAAFDADTGTMLDWSPALSPQGEDSYRAFAKAVGGIVVSGYLTGDVGNGPIFISLAYISDNDASVQVWAGPGQYEETTGLASRGPVLFFSGSRSIGGELTSGVFAMDLRNQRLLEWYLPVSGLVNQLVLVDRYLVLARDGFHLSEPPFWNENVILELPDSWLQAMATP